MIVYNNQAPKAVNNVGQFGATEGSIGAYKSAAEYAADAKYWVLLSQTKYSSVEEILAEVERLYAQGRLLEDDIKQLKLDFESQEQILLGLIQSTGTAIDNTNAATELSKEATQNVLAQLDIISNMTVQTSLLPPGSLATGSYDNTTGVFSFGIPEGQPGRDGTDGTISDIGSVAIGTPVSDDYGFYVDKEDGGLYRASMAEIANLVPSVRSISINGGEEQFGSVSFNSVSSFNTRTGNVLPASGDYSVNQIIGAAASGVNSDITSLTGLTTALSIEQGGTGADTPEKARTNLELGSVSIENIVPITKGGTGASTAGGARTNLGLGLVSTESIVPIAKGGTGATSSENARLALVSAKSGDNYDITSLHNLTTALSIPQGGTGASTAGGARDNLSVYSKSESICVVGSFNDLRTKKPTNEGDVVYLKGYYQDSVLGGGEFIGRLSGFESVVDNGGTVAKGSDFYWERSKSSEKFTVECFGAKHYLGEDASAAFDNSEVFQRAFDTIGYLYSSAKERNYRVDAPVKLSGSGFSIDFSNGIISKTTNTKTGVSTLVPVFGGYADANINCVFYSTDTVRYFTVKNVSIWCNQSDETDRPVAFFIPSATNYNFSHVQTRDCKHDFWFKNAWRGSFTECRTNHTVSHSWFYDGTRVDSSGSPTIDSQSATSLDFLGCYSNSPGGSGFYLNRVDYSNFSISAVDHSGEASYRLISSNCAGTIGAENPTKNYVHCTGGVYNLYISTYDDVEDLSNYVIKVDGSSTVLNIKGQFRTQKYRLADVSGNGNSVVIGESTYWNGVSSSTPQSICSSGNYLDVAVANGASVRKYRNGRLQEYRASYPSYTSQRGLTTTWNVGGVLRVGIPAAGTSFTVPLYRISEIFPNFNKTSDNAEWISCRVTNGNGLSYGAIFQANSGVIQKVDLSNQKYTDLGGENARITDISISGDNVIFSLQGSVGPSAVLQLSYLS